LHVQSGRGGGWAPAAMDQGWQPGAQTQPATLCGGSRAEGCPYSPNAHPPTQTHNTRTDNTQPQHKQRPPTVSSISLNMFERRNISPASWLTISPLQQRRAGHGKQGWQGEQAGPRGGRWGQVAAAGGPVRGRAQGSSLKTMLRRG
jgi:hypothetical protein